MQNKMIRIVIESPYAGRIEENVTYARKCMADALHRGEAPIASHLLYTQEGILCDEIPEDRKLGIEAGFAWGECADYIVFYTDLGLSNGMNKAKIYWMNRKKKIIMRKLGED